MIIITTTIIAAISVPEIPVPLPCCCPGEDTLDELSFIAVVVAATVVAGAVVVAATDVTADAVVTTVVATDVVLIDDVVALDFLKKASIAPL
jgi:hypothetical protein